MKRIFRLVAIAAIAIPCTPQAASAQDASPTAAPSTPSRAAPNALGSAEDQELARLDLLLKGFSAEANDYRVVFGVTSLAMGAVAIPAGVSIMNKQDDALAGPLLVGLGVLDATLGGLLLVDLLGPQTPLQALSNTVDEQRSARKSSSDIIAAVESDWQKRASRARFFRQLAGGVAIVSGAALMGWGAYLAFTDPENPDPQTREDHYAAAGVLIALGSFGPITGVAALVLQSPVEASWSTYRSMKPVDVTPPVRLSGFGATPLPGGGALTLRGTF